MLPISFGSLTARRFSSSTDTSSCRDLSVSDKKNNSPHVSDVSAPQVNDSDIAGVTFGDVTIGPDGLPIRSQLAVDLSDSTFPESRTDQKVSDHTRAKSEKSSEELEDEWLARHLHWAPAVLLAIALGVYCGFVECQNRGYIRKNKDAVLSVNNKEPRGRPALGGPFSLVRCSDGMPVTQADFLGQWTVFYFGFVHCPEICPVELNRMSKVVDLLREKAPIQQSFTTNKPFDHWGERDCNDKDVIIKMNESTVGKRAEITPIFISCDPQRDSLDSIEEYLKAFHPDLVGLVGTPEQVNQVCKNYCIYYSVPEADASAEGDYLIDHSIAMFFFDPKGNFVDFFSYKNSEEHIAETVLKHMEKYALDDTWTNW